MGIVVGIVVGVIAATTTAVEVVGVERIAGIQASCGSGCDRGSCRGRRGLSRGGGGR